MKARVINIFINPLAFLAFFILLIITISTALAHQPPISAQISPVVANWWPSDNVTISGVQPFKGVVNGWNISDYSMYWSVDNGQENFMPTKLGKYDHKEVDVNVIGWNWQSSNRYTIRYIAKTLSGNEIARTSFTVIVATQYQTPLPFIVTTQYKTPPPVIAPSTKPFSNSSFYVDPNSNAKLQATTWLSTRPADAAQIDKIANQPVAKWFGNWNNDVLGDVGSYVTAASAQSRIPILVAYNIPQRDCGGYSAGGTTATAYIDWIKKLTEGIGTRKAIVVVEPDALAGLGCLSATDQSTRLSLMAQAVTILKSNPSTSVYLDAGNYHWQPKEVIADRLKAANVSAADGFSLNVSNFYTTADNATYGQNVSALIGQKHFVIDTSRNGLGPTSDNQWCNPTGRALGAVPTGQVSNALIDAYLWIKAPGESDGPCNGGPNAGVWWADYALGLAQRASY